MPKQNQTDLVPIIVEAVRLVGQRMLIAKFWDETSEFSDADDVFFIKKYPHLKLFPRMAAVIHHGGAGTTASCAISGVPQIIVPHILDQYYWGHKVYRSHLGTRPIWRSKLNTQRLATAIHECLSNDMIRQKAIAASETINQGDSLEITVREICKKNEHVRLKQEELFQPSSWQELEIDSKLQKFLDGLGSEEITGSQVIELNRFLL